jgi:hypothetical protein
MKSTQFGSTGQFRVKFEQRQEAGDAVETPPGAVRAGRWWWRLVLMEAFCPGHGSCTPAFSEISGQHDQQSTCSICDHIKILPVTPLYTTTSNFNYLKPAKLQPLVWLLHLLKLSSRLWQFESGRSFIFFLWPIYQMIFGIIGLQGGVEQNLELGDLLFTSMLKFWIE